LKSDETYAGKPVYTIPKLNYEQAFEEVCRVINNHPELWERAVARGYAFMGGVGSVIATGSVSVHVTRANYPAPPPATFRLNADAEEILVRYERYRDGREPLQGMAHYCLTVVERTARTKKKKREDAAKLYRIDLLVLNKMGELTSTRDDGRDARKASAVQTLTTAEHTWLEAAVKMLIWRLGDTRDSAALPKITMADLPTL
jgi:hypothetical protein